MSYQPDPANDPNDAYAVISTPAELRGPPTDWWTATRHGEPVRHFPPTARDRAGRHRFGLSATTRELEDGA
jgi:hypothetical protein